MSYENAAKPSWQSKRFKTRPETKKGFSSVGLTISIYRSKSGKKFKGFAMSNAF